jgi:2'-5' RNA ligase superfamily protein
MAHGQALWLLPEAGAFTVLSAVIAALARAEGGPRFEPHVTLLSGITAEGEDLRERVRALARGQAPAAVVLTRARQRPEFFKALFLEVEGGDLHCAHRRAAAAMGMTPPAEYLPHLSLLYGDFAPARKDAILDRIGRRWDEPCLLDRLALVSPQGPPPSWVRASTLALGAR